ncbi:fasting-inducible integral membrane protein tm6p1-related [Anaeramoeba ignava]|uniref:Fasting-inducible integral membrane protein tm6p1-related n=1 Tax=Anaeramoeba ignava TaxID=1746090 RepID=A0A9Q0L7A9_ANAIG|nr:fasting-inducible integral membrane protein tm6p1-related [Anaeramoeba ignava]
MELENILEDSFQDIQFTNENNKIIGKRNLRLILPITLLIGLFTIVLCYSLTMTRKDIGDDRIPVISETSVYQPENFFFSLGMFIVAILFMVMAMGLYSYIKLKIHKRFGEKKDFLSPIEIPNLCTCCPVNIHSANTFALILGFIAMICLVFLSSVTLAQYRFFHLSSAFIFFVSAGFHGFFCDAILYKLYRKQLQINLNYESNEIIIEENSENQENSENIEENIEENSENENIEENIEENQKSKSKSKSKSKIQNQNNIQNQNQNNIQKDLKREKSWFIYRFILDISEILCFTVLSSVLSIVLRSKGYSLDPNSNSFRNMGAIVQYSVLISLLLHTLGYVHELSRMKIIFFSSI